MQVDLQSLIVDALSADNAVQQSVAARFDALQRAPVPQRVAVATQLIALLGDSTADSNARRMAATMVNNIITPPAAFAQPSAASALPLPSVQESLLLALSDGQKSVQGAAASCISQLAKFHFSSHGTGWPELPEKLRTLCDSGDDTYQRGAASCLALVGEDCGRDIVSAEGEAALQLRQDLLGLVVSLIDLGQSVECRRKAVLAATHFVRAAALPTIGIDDFNEEGEIDPTAESRYSLGREQLRRLVALLGPKFVTTFESMTNMVAGLVVSGGADAVYAAVVESDAAPEAWKDISTTVDGFNTMLTFDDELDGLIAPAVQSLAATFAAVSWAIATREDKAGGRAGVMHGAAEDAIHGFATQVLSLVTDVVIPDDRGTAAVAMMDGGHHDEYEVDVPLPSDAALAIAAATGAASLRDAFFIGLMNLGMRLSDVELEDLSLGADGHIPDAATDVMFVLHRPDDAEDANGDLPNDDDSDESDTEDPSELTALRHASTWCLNTMTSVMCDELLDSLLPLLRLHLDRAASFTGSDMSQLHWEPYEHALLAITELVDSALPQIVSRGAADAILEAVVALAAPGGPAATVGPIRAAACKVLGKFSVSIVDLAVGVVKSKRMSVDLLAPVAARCVAGLGASLSDCNKAVQKSAFLALTSLTAHVAAVADDDTEEDSDEDDDEYEDEDENSGAVGGADPHSSLVLLLPFGVIEAIYTTLASQYSGYQLEARALLYDLLSTTAGADKALCSVVQRPAPVLRRPDVAECILAGLVSAWIACRPAAPGAAAIAVREAAAIAECLGTLVSVIGPDVVAVVPQIVATAADIIALPSSATPGDRIDADADEDAVAATIDLVSSCSDALGPDLAFQHLLTPELLAAVGALASAQLEPTDSCETQRAAFAVLGDFATAVAMQNRAAVPSAPLQAIDGIVQTHAAPLVPFAFDVLNAVVQSLFAYRVEHVRANVNALYCAAEWVAAMPRQVIADALRRTGTNNAGLFQFAKMVSLFASSDAIDRGGDANFRQNAHLVVTRLLFAFPSAVAAMLPEGLGVSLAIGVSRLDDATERADCLWRIGVAITASSGDAVGLGAALDAARQRGLPLDFAVDDAAGYGAVGTYFSQHPQECLKLCATAVTMTASRGESAYAKHLVNGLKQLWGPIASAVLPSYSLESKAAKKAFTKTERSALQRVAGA